MKRIAIFASGNGTKRPKIIEYFRHNPEIKIECIVCNNAKAGVIEVANEANIPYYLITKKDLYQTDHVLDLLQAAKLISLCLPDFSG